MPQSTPVFRFLAIALLFVAIFLAVRHHYAPDVVPGRSTFGVAFEPGHRWSAGFPLVFVRILDRPRTLVERLRDSGRRATILEYIIGRLDDAPPPAAINVIVTETNRCQQHDPNNASHPNFDNWVDLEPHDLSSIRLTDVKSKAIITPAVTRTSVIRYVGDATPQLYGVAPLPGPRKLNVVSARIPSAGQPGAGFLEMRCFVAIEPQRISFARYRIQFDVIFGGRTLFTKGPAVVRISPPWNSAAWEFEGGDRTDAVPKIQTDFTDEAGNVERDRDDHVRSDFPSQDITLNQEMPTTRVSWKYDDDEATREFGILFWSIVLGLILTALYELGAHVRRRAKKTEADTATR